MPVLNCSGPAAHEACAFGLRRRLLSPDHFQPLFAKINGRKINIAWLDTHKLCSGCSLLFGLCIEDRKLQTGRRKGTRSQEARQMTLSVSWTTRLDFKTFLTACRNAWDGGGEFNTEN